MYSLGCKLHPYNIYFITGSFVPLNHLHLFAHPPTHLPSPRRSLFPVPLEMANQGFFVPLPQCLSQQWPLVCSSLVLGPDGSSFPSRQGGSALSPHWSLRGQHSFLLAALGLCCGTWALCCTARASLVVALGLSCSEACGILVP